jgi:di/tricarboxylate transporter
VTLPVFRSLSDAADDRRITRALALLVPSVILVATIATLIGAGSHLIANDLLARIAGERISFAAWALYGVPFALVASAITTWVVLRLFLDPAQRARRLPPVARAGARGPLSRAERTTLGVTLAMLALWLTEGVHGLQIATVTVVGALALTLPGAGVLTWKRGLEAVSWNLVLFVGAALALGEALIETGAARWLIGELFAALGVASADSRLVLIVLVTVIALTSHLYITSHAARAAALVPPLIYLARDTGLDPAAVMFIGTVGMNYCLTFPVSSKALLMFSELDGETFEGSDLLKLSAVMLVVHLALVVVFALTWWPLVGLSP